MIEWAIVAAIVYGVSALYSIVNSYLGFVWNPISPFYVAWHKKWGIPMKSLMVAIWITGGIAWPIDSLWKLVQSFIYYRKERLKLGSESKGLLNLPKDNTFGNRAIVTAMKKSQLRK